MQFLQVCLRLCVSSFLDIFLSFLSRNQRHRGSYYFIFLFLLAFPAPLLFGLAIDNTCLIQDTSCGTEGRCLVYDRNSFRFTLHGLALGVKVAAVLCYIVGFLFSRMDRYDIELNEEEKDNQKNQDLDTHEHFLKEEEKQDD